MNFGSLRASLTREPSENSNDINILFVGETGCGKSTFINATEPYLRNETMDQAIVDQLNPWIPFSFIQQNDDLDDQVISFGEIPQATENRKDGDSDTRICQSYSFKVRDKTLRLIDTPGIGDTDGFEQDMKNFQTIANCISQFSHLNAICFVMRPDEKRSTVQFKYCFNELLRHFDQSVRENIVFVFTFSRTTFFKPGNTTRMLRRLLEEHEKDFGLLLKFDEEKSFFFDNEAFRYIAMVQKGYQVQELMKTSSYDSWQHCKQSYVRFMEYIVNRPACSVDRTLDLFDAERIIRKLPRPMANILKLIEENIEFGENFKREMIENPDVAKRGFPQAASFIRKLRYPRTVCSSEKCCRLVEENGERNIRFEKICHEECYLHGIAQEVIGDERLEDCEAMGHDNGLCRVCRCPWKTHLHITYEDGTRIEYIHSLTEIDERIRKLRDELREINEINESLNLFLQANALIPINNTIVEYLNYHIRSQKTDRSGRSNRELNRKLEQLKADILKNNENITELMKKYRDDPLSVHVPSAGEVADLIKQLFNLPLTGAMIRQQVQGIGSFEKPVMPKEEQRTLPERSVRNNIVQAFLN